MADGVELIEPAWAMLHAQPRAQQLQQRSSAGLAGARPRAGALFTGAVTLLTAGAFSVVPGGGGNTQALAYG